MNNFNSNFPADFPHPPTATPSGSRLRCETWLGTVSLCFAASALAAEALPEQTAAEADVVLEKVIVTDKFPSVKNLGASEMEADILESKRAAVSDTAKLLEDTPGVSLYGAGGVSSLPVIHGMNDDRVKIDINGMTLTSACANHMNPPLSYIDRSNIGKITILTGVTPVSLGGDSIGGTISVQTPEPVFAEPGKDILLDGAVSSFYRSNGDAFGGSIAAGVATQNVRLDYTGSHTESMNYNDGNGQIVNSTAYVNQNHSAALSFKSDNHLVVVRGGQQHMPYQLFPNQRMDLTNNDSIFGNIMHKGSFDWGTLESKFYFESTQHSMDIGDDKHNRYLDGTPAGGGFAFPNDRMPMETRGRNLGYKILAEIPYGKRDTFRIGNEYHANKLNDYWPAVHNDPGPANPTPNPAYWMMAPQNYINLNNAEKERVAFFGEWEARWNEQWKSLLGLRYEHTSTDTGNVSPYNPNLLGTNGNLANNPDPAGAKLALTAANAFNARDKGRTNDTFDVTALVQFTPNDMSQYELGYARKNRTPNLYERYVWGARKMDMAMIGWFGDGNGYVGNMDLTEETAHTVSLTAAFHEPQNNLWEVNVTPYFTYVNNFIDADRCLVNTNPARDANGCRTAATSYTGGPTINNLTVDNQYVYLQYANHDARLWGMDVSGRTRLYKDQTLGEFAAHTTMSYVRGERMDGGNLYHMMPFNMKLSLDHRLSSWQSALEMQFVDGKSHVQQIRNEVQTPSYILLNARTGYEWGNFRLDVGLDNVLDKQYFHPLAGSYLGDRYGMNPTAAPNVTVPWGRNVPGMGRSAFVGVTIKY
ncbi:TonB-dependent receptor [Methylomonas koyamae]|uniref:TonB-dependent receptor n=1 Tax=Methylomonas koyamae TaxID=702114 RepID=UPI002872B564|nr:TonB-dependent receptor [Methylomonas koyamae]WNB77492.1 TonB-dependent receptor plug domain-containing protein [Methylomonas koyamae]